MPYPAQLLITRAYNLSQIVSRKLQTVSDQQITDGLYLLNALLDIKGTDTKLIPYYTHYTFNTIAGQELYYIPNLLNIDTLTFNIGQVRYSMNEFTRAQYFAISRVDNIQSLPFSYRIERVLGGSNIYLYFVPADVYNMVMLGKFSLTDVTLQTDMATLYDLFYIEYLRYSLAEMICCEYGVTLPDESKEMLKQYVKKLSLVSPSDISIQGDNYFDKGWGMDWQVANLTTGFWPF